MMLEPGPDLFPLAAAVLTAVTCGLLGNFLVLRRLSLMGDAISHSVLPGLVVAFLITSTRSPLVMFAGAAIAGTATVVLVELVKRLGRVEPGAAMGVVFSVLFALGVLMMEKAAAGNVDLDAECVLHGNLEALAWYGGPSSWSGVLTAGVLEAMPRQVWTLLVMCGSAFVFVGLLFKELRIAAFDPALATSQGYHAGVLHYVLMGFVAAATVASFEAVGSILVIAMLVCPAASARLLTDRLGSQIVWSVVIAIATAALGYWGATAIPDAFGKAPVNAAGSMAMASGVLLTGAAVIGPRHGVAARLVRQRLLARRVAYDDVLATLYRLTERGEAPTPEARLATMGGGGVWRRAIRRAAASDHVRRMDGGLSLTAAGRQAAEAVVRRHRQWESYLVDRAGVAADHVHDTAEVLEHLGVEPGVDARVDPHGRRIPDGDDSARG